MPTLSQKWHRSRKARWCDNCPAAIHTGERYLSMFGMAERGDKPCTITLCETCGTAEEERQERICSYEYVNRVYSVRAVAGERVKVGGKLGTILKPLGSAALLQVRFDGERRRMWCHPTHEIEYLGTVGGEA